MLGLLEVPLVVGVYTNGNLQVTWTKIRTTKNRKTEQNWLQQSGSSSFSTNNLHSLVLGRLNRLIPAQEQKKEDDPPIQDSMHDLWKRKIMNCRWAPWARIRTYKSDERFNTNDRLVPSIKIKKNLEDRNSTHACDYYCTSGLSTKSLRPTLLVLARRAKSTQVLMIH